MGTEPQRDDDAWIERVVEIGGSLGFNKMRLRWKLLRWQESRRKARRWREQRIAHIRYEHKTCAECGAVQDRGEAICTRCRAKLTSRTLQVLQRVGLTTPEFLSMSTLLVLSFIGVHLRLWLAAGTGAFSLSSQLLIDFGGRYPPLLADEPWRMLTAIFLHAGLIHLAFNVVATASIGPRIEELYGRLTVLLLFVVTGTLANVGSWAVGVDGVGIGASGGIMGLVGAAAGHGQRVGTSYGKALRNSMLQWAVYVIVYGFWVHADNAAHVVGFLAGAIFGYFVRPAAWKHPRLVAVRAVTKLAGIAAAIAALAIIFTRQPSPPAAPPLPPQPFVDDEDLEDINDKRIADATLWRDLWPDYVQVCRMYYDGRVTDAVAVLQTVRARSRVVATETPHSAWLLCEALAYRREGCRDLAAGSTRVRVPRALRPRCDEFVRLFEGIPDDATRASLPEPPPP
jgi:rhomboid protease GluP